MGAPPEGSEGRKKRNVHAKTPFFRFNMDISAPNHLLVHAFIATSELCMDKTGSPTVICLKKPENVHAKTQKQGIYMDIWNSTSKVFFLRMAWVKCCSSGMIPTSIDNYLRLAWQVEGPPVSFGQEYARNDHAKLQKDEFGVVFLGFLLFPSPAMLSLAATHPVLAGRRRFAALACCLPQATVWRWSQGQAERLPRSGPAP